MSQEWTKETIQALLTKSDRAVVKALKLIYARQTEGERRSKQTTEANNRGFTGADAEILTDIAQKLARYNDHLTPRQLSLVRRKMMKYWRQLLEEINPERQAMSERAAYLLGGRVKPGITSEPETLPMAAAAGVGESNELYGAF